MNKQQRLAASYGASQETIRSLKDREIRVTGRLKVIRELNEEFPGILATPVEDFSREHQTGIWFRGSESCAIKEEISLTEADGTVITETFDVPIYDSNMYMDTFGTHPKLEKFLQDRGWYSEGYDSGTLMAYK